MWGWGFQKILRGSWFEEAPNGHVAPGTAVKVAKPQPQQPVAADNRGSQPQSKVLARQCLRPKLDFKRPPTSYRGNHGPLGLELPKSKTKKGSKGHTQERAQGKHPENTLKIL